MASAATASCDTGKKARGTKSQGSHKLDTVPLQRSSHEPHKTIWCARSRPWAIFSLPPAYYRQRVRNKLKKFCFPPHPPFPLAPDICTNFLTANSFQAFPMALLFPISVQCSNQVLPLLPSLSMTLNEGEM